MACLTTHWLALVTLLAAACAFNIDLDTFVKHREQAGSMFGFSVALYQHRNQNWLVVGAPEAQTQQPGVVRGGAVFRCNASRDDACQEVSFDISGNNKNSAGQQIDRKSEQWFGATVQTSVANGVIVACAPRYVSFSSLVERRDPVGTCWVSKNDFSDMAEYSPCRTRKWGYHRQGSCQAGLGAAVSEDGERLFVGAVGSWFWQGQLFDISSQARLPFYPPGYQDYGAGQLYSQSLTQRPSVLATKEGPAQDDNSYLGYSVTAGDFDGLGQPGVAVGMPRGAGLVGKVVLYSWDLVNSRNITGDQIGAYFGYAICNSDVDGDGLTDLIIGAPLYTDPKNNEGHYENGRVYIVYQGIEKKFGTVHSRDGVNSKARFGLSVASLGDVNRDGFGDFVVGAPYDGVRGRGAVYIFHGSKAGCQEKPSQVITAEDVGFELSTFGFSVAGGHDLDNNQYPDLAVGAYESDTAIFLKSRPVVRMSATLQFGSASKLVSLKEKNCTTRAGVAVSCLPLTACFTYTGLGVDRRLEFEILLLLDTRKSKDLRMLFLEDESKTNRTLTVRLDHGSRYCKSQTVFIKSTLRDKLTPLEAELRYTLIGRTYSSSTTRAQRSLTPILDQAAASAEKDSVHIEKNCGKDNVCVPDLKLVVTPSVDKYLLGSGNRFTLNVIVENSGEDSFESSFSLHLPPGMNYTKTERLDDFEGEIPVQCSAPSRESNNTLKCDIGNPLPRKKLVNFLVLLSPFHRPGMTNRYEFTMEVNSTNPEAKGATADNRRQLSIPIMVQTDHVVSGYSYPSTEIAYNMSAYRESNVTTETEVGPQVVHVYSIKNQGPSDIVEAEAFFVWPSHTREDEPLLYLLEQPQTLGNVVCEPVPEANALRLQLDTRGKKSALEFHGLAASAQASAEASAAEMAEAGAMGSGGGRAQAGRVLTEEERRAGRQQSSFRTGSISSSGSSSSFSSSSSSSSSSFQQGGSSSNSSADRAANEEILKRGGRIYAQGVRSHVAEGSSIHEESGSYQGGTHARGGGLAVLEQDYSRFNSQGSGSQGSGSQGSGSQGSGSQGSGSQTSGSRGSGVQVSGSQSSVSQSSGSQSSGSQSSGSQSSGSQSSGSRGSASHGSGSHVSVSESSGSRGSGAWGTGAQGSGSQSSGSRGSASHGSGSLSVSESSGSRGSTSHGSGSQSSGSRGSGSLSVSESSGSRGSASYGSEAQGSGSQSSGSRGSGSLSVSESSGSRGSGAWGTGAQGSGSQTGGSHSTRTQSASETSQTYGSSGSRTQSGDNVGQSGSRTSIASGEADYNGGSSNSESSERGGSGRRGGAATRTQHGGRTQFNADLGGGERSFHESQNFSATVTDDSGVPRTYRNFSFANSTGAGSVSGGWQEGDLGLGSVGAAHSSHESRVRDYGNNARETNLEQHSLRSGYNVGNPRSEERHWSTERRTGLDGLAVYNWTNPIASFGQDNARVRVTARPRNREPGFDTTDEIRQRETAALAALAARREQEEVRAEEERIRLEERRLDYERERQARERHRAEAEERARAAARASSRSESRSSSSRTETSRSETSSSGVKSSRERSGDDALEDVDSRFQLYGRYERSVGQMTNLNALDADGSAKNAASFEDSRWDRPQRDEDAEGSSAARQASDDAVAQVLACAATKCSTFKCKLGPLRKDEEVFVGMRFRAWARTLDQVAWNRPVQLSSLAAARVTRLPHIGEPDELSLKTAEVKFDVFPAEAPVRPDIVPLWVVVLSACAGAVILLLLIFLLYKCGFFKRQRPTDTSAEKQPLNRNGHFNSGDEAL